MSNEMPGAANDPLVACCLPALRFALVLPKWQQGTTFFGMTSISLKLPERLDSRLAEEAKRRRTSKSAVVRECVEAMLQTSPDEQAPSCLDLARDLAGCLDGPADIATNPKYLDDFGK